MKQQILHSARAQLKHHGAAQLSLRAVARDIGVASSAVYRYVASRDDLLTLLVVDSYGDLADAVEGAHSRTDSPRSQFIAVGHAMRTWALHHREQWSLLYGTPVPGYAAPSELTTGPGTRVAAIMLRIVEQAFSDDSPNPSPSTPMRQDVEDFVRDIATELDVRMTPAQIALTLPAWSSIIGAISSELFGHVGHMPDNVGAFVMELTLREWASILKLA